jgi:hypothetical protein
LRAFGVTVSDETNHSVDLEPPMVTVLPGIDHRSFTTSSNGGTRSGKVPAAIAALSRIAGRIMFSPSARVEGAKGSDILVEALLLMVKRQPDLHLVIGDATNDGEKSKETLALKVLLLEQALTGGVGEGYCVNHLVGDATGNVRMNVVPLGLVSTSTLPSWCSTMDRTSGKP